MRKHMLVVTVLSVLAILLASCGSAPAPTATAVPASTTAPTSAVAAPSAAPTLAPTKAPSTATPAPARPKVVRIGLGSYPVSLDPQKIWYTYEINVAQLLYEGLLHVSPTGEIYGAAAEKWQLSPDGKSLTFSIRAGIKRADGTPVTAKDFEYTYKRLADPRAGCPLGSLYTAVVGVDAALGTDPTLPADQIQKVLDATGYKAVDDRTFQVTFKESCGYWHYVATMYSGYPVDPKIVEKDPDAWWTKVENLNGNGPYRILKIEENRMISFVANPNYWGAKPKLDRLELYFITDSTLAQKAYEKGELDMVGVAAEDYPRVQADPVLSKELVRGPGAGTSMLAFRNDQPPFDKVEVRKAFAMAFDRESWARDVLKGMSKPYTGWIIPGRPGYDDKALQEGYDPQKAVQTLIDAGYGAADSTPDKPKIDCKKLGTIKLTYTASSRNHMRFQYIAGMFASVFGCPVTLDPVDGTTLSAMNKSSTTAPAFTYTMIFEDYPHPQNWLFPWVCGGPLPQVSYCNPTFDKQLAAANAEVDQAKALALYKTALNTFVFDYPVAFTAYTELFYLVKPYLIGFREQFGSADMGYVGSYGKSEQFDVDLTKVGAGYPSK